MRKQSLVLSVANFLPYIAVGARVFNESCREGMRLSRCRFEEGRFERQHFAAIGRRAFWKEHDERAAVQHAAHFAGNAGNIRTFDKGPCLSRTRSIYPRCRSRSSRLRNRLPRAPFGNQQMNAAGACRWCCNTRHGIRHSHHFDAIDFYRRVAALKHNGKRLGQIHRSSVWKLCGKNKKIRKCQ